MTKGSDNEFPSVLFDEQASDPSTPASGFWRAYFKAGGLYVIDDAGAVTGPLSTGGGGGGLLAVTRYAPTSAAIYTITGTSMADVDATNLAVTFTAPASGNVLVRLNAFADITALDEFFWGLREGSSDLPGIARVIRVVGDAGYLSVAFYLTGVSAGSHTYKWSAGVLTATARIIIMDGSAINEWGPGIMEVWAAP